MKSDKNHSRQKLINFPLNQNRKFAIRILQHEAQHDEKMDRVDESGIDTAPWRIDLIDVALDILGVPADNTVELIDKHGQSAYDQPGVFCRDYFYQRWGEAEKTQKGIQRYVDWVLQELELPTRN
jgi:hypothetical protein